MSVIFITDHDENILDVTKVHPDYVRKRVYFKSQHSNRLRKFYKKCVRLHATMGVPEETPPDPAKFLKKHTGRPAYIDRCRIPPREIKPPKSEAEKEKNKTPTLEELRLQERKKLKPKNFVKRNIKLAMEMKTKDPVPQVVIDRNGTKKAMTAGMEPVFLQSPQFGKPPPYLMKFINSQKKKIYFEKDMVGSEKPKGRYLTKEERDDLLKGLKDSWEEIQVIYKTLPIQTDTLTKRKREVKVTNEIKNIEKDIKLIEESHYIWVYEDDDIVIPP